MQLFTACISTTLVLVLLGMVVSFVMLADKLSDSVRETFTVTVLFHDEASEEDAIDFGKQLQVESFISRVTYVSKEQALEEQVAAMGTDPTEFLGSNPFTASLELQMSAGYANTDSLLWIAQNLKERELVADVVYQKDLIDNLNKNLRKVSLVLLILAGLLMMVSFGLIHSTVRLSIYSRRFLIHTMKLVGASWEFIRRPFMWRSFWVGMVSAIVADSILLSGLHLLVQYDEALSPLITDGLKYTVAAVVVICGLSFTLLCSYFSVNAYLKMKESEMYEI